MPKYEYCMANVWQRSITAGEGLGSVRAARPARTDYKAVLFVEGMEKTDLFVFSTDAVGEQSSLTDVRIRALNILGGEGWSLAGSKYWTSTFPSTWGCHLTFVREVQDTQADS